MKIDVNGDLAARLASVARRRGVSPSSIVRGWISKALDVLDSSDSSNSSSFSDAGASNSGCRVPECSSPPSSLGLCERHYQRLRYYQSRGALDEGWCVRHGKQDLPRGKRAEDFALVEETAEKLPRDPPNDRLDTRWFFGWPDAQILREKVKRMERTVGDVQGFFGDILGGTLVVGEAPSQEDFLAGHEGEDAVAIPRLAELCGLSLDDFRSSFARANVLDEWPGREDEALGDSFPCSVARERWERGIGRPEILGIFRRVVFLGRRAASLVEVVTPRTPWFRWSRSSVFVPLGDGDSVEYLVDFAVAPHPSGLSRWWSDPANVERARIFWGGLARSAAHRAGCSICSYVVDAPCGGVEGAPSTYEGKLPDDVLCEEALP